MRSAEPSCQAFSNSSVDGLGGQRVAVAAVHQGDGPAVAEDDLAVLVADDHALGERVEGPTQPDGVRAGLGDGLGGVFRGAFDMAERVLEPSGVSWQRVGTEPVAEGDESLLERLEASAAAEGVRHADQAGGDTGGDREVRNAGAHNGDHGRPGGLARLQHCSSASQIEPLHEKT